MKKIAAFVLVISSLLAVGCTKSDLPPENYDPEQWMQTHQRAEVAYTDYFSGNYIVQTSQGFAVIENWSGYTPRGILMCSTLIFSSRVCKPFITVRVTTLPAEG
jgi:outer membrane biogenesis lipoprotein LolB